MSECKKSADIVYFPTEGGVIIDPAAFDACGAGAMAADEEVISGGDGFIYLHLPANNDRGWEDAGAVRVYRTNPPKGDVYPAWKITGDVANPKTLTLSPSIHLQGVWHGYLREGKLVSC